MKTRCKILLSISLTIILLNAGYYIINSYNVSNFSLMHFSTGFATGLLIVFTGKEIIKFSRKVLNK